MKGQPLPTGTSSVHSLYNETTSVKLYWGLCCNIMEQYTVENFYMDLMTQNSTWT